MNNIKLHIIYRACDKIIARGEAKNDLSKPVRPFCQNKTELVMTCFNSLYASLKSSGVDAEIHVVGDRLSSKLIDFFKKHECELTLGAYGNDESLRTCFRLAQTLPDYDWVYFCEDDYLHTIAAISEIVALINARQEILSFQPKKFRLISIFKRFTDLPLFIHPTDYPDRYIDRSGSRFSLLFQSPIAPFTHWRQIQNTTFTFVTQVLSAKKFQKRLIASCKGADDSRLSRIYRNWPIAPKSICVSPIPSLAAHLHPSTMPRAGDWQALFSQYQAKIS